MEQVAGMDAAVAEEDNKRVRNNEQMKAKGNLLRFNIPCSIFEITTEGGIPCQDKIKQAPQEWGR